jgi:tRNA-2-methylthio-N6-dimethylallyladenosine synthase
VLIEGFSKRSEDFYYGRNTQNTVVVFPKMHFQVGDLVQVRIDDCTAATLLGTPLETVGT